MKIEAVIVCVNYGDFLAHTIRSTKATFDRLVVVTSPADKHTQRVCAYHHVQCLPTSEVFSGGSYGHPGKCFDKARGINYGLRHLSLSDWACHLDADILLPPRTREILEKIHLDPQSIYGIDRMMCVGYDAFQGWQNVPELMHEDEIFVRANAFPLGVRVAKLSRDPDLPDVSLGYVPIGFFQLWNPAATGRKVYPEGHHGAARSDMLFALEWDRRHRHLIPEIVAIHLESEPVEMGANWNGRATRRFGA